MSSSQKSQKNSGLGPVSQKSRNFSGAFRWHNSRCFFKAKASQGTKRCSYFNFYSLYNILKDHLYRISGSQSYEWLFRPEKFSGLSRNGPLKGDPNPDFCVIDSVLDKLSYQANLELVVMWVDYQPVDVEIDDDDIRILVFEMCIGMNEFWSSHSWALHRHRRGLGSSSRSGLNFPDLSRCCSSSAKIRSFRSAFQIQEFLYYHYSQLSCHFLNQLESKVTSNSCALSEYANYLSPWLKNTINSQYFWWLWSSPDHLTEGFAIKDNMMLFWTLARIGFAHGNWSYRAPCPTGTFVPPLKSYEFWTALVSSCIPCPPGEFPWRVIWKYNVSIFYFI